MRRERRLKKHGDMQGMLRQLKDFGISSKHAGSKSAKKIKNLLRQSNQEISRYSRIMSRLRGE